MAYLMNVVLLLIVISQVCLGVCAWRSHSNPVAPGFYWMRSDGSGEPRRLTDVTLGGTCASATHPAVVACEAGARRKIQLLVLPTTKVIAALKKNPKEANAILHVTC
jgi:hypothetical protein